MKYLIFRGRERAEGFFALVNRITVLCAVVGENPLVVMPDADETPLSVHGAAVILLEKG